MSLQAIERETYREMWSAEGYGDFSPGAHFLPVFLQMAGSQLHPEHEFLDAGCGSGKGALALQAAGYNRVSLTDFTDDGLSDEARLAQFVFKPACLWSDLGSREFDWVYCCDVLEHIPPMFTMLVAARLLAVAQRGVFFSISLTPDRFGVMVGKPLHQTVESFVTWRDALAELGTVQECRDLVTAGVYLVTPQ